MSKLQWQSITKYIARVMVDIVRGQTKNKLQH